MRCLQGLVSYLSLSESSEIGSHKGLSSDITHVSKDQYKSHVYNLKGVHFSITALNVHGQTF